MAKVVSERASSWFKNWEEKIKHQDGKVSVKDNILTFQEK